jgi:hypothetical protein
MAAHIVNSRWQSGSGDLEDYEAGRLALRGVAAAAPEDAPSRAGDAAAPVHRRGAPRRTQGNNPADSGA